MKKKKAFTLIELLAVIIILGIVALIATPIVINVVENAQKKAFERSAQGYYDAARYVYNDMMLNEEEKDTMFIFENSVQRSDNPKYTLSVQGEVPKKGLVYLTKDGEVLVSIANDKWCATTNGDGTVELTDDPNACGYAPEECFTFSDFTLTDKIKTEINNQNLGFEGMDGALLQVDSFDKENPACKGMVIIPNEHEGRKVEGIKAEAFSSYKNSNLNITSVILPKEMKIIGESAFDSASSLKQVILNEELRYIDSYAFVETSLMEVTIPSKVVYLGREVFADSRLKKVNLLAPNVKSVATANNSPFANTLHEGRNAIEEVTIGPNVQSIPGYLFYGQAIKTLNMPDSVVIIGKYAFASNQITSLDIPDSVTSIESLAFKNNQITNLTIGKAVSYIKNNSNTSPFYQNPLTNLTIREGATLIPAYSFADFQIENLSIASTVTSIEDAAFSNNKLPDNQAFIYARNSDGSENKTILNSYGGAKKDNVIIPSSVNTIGKEAFRYTDIVSVTIPNSVATISDYAFANNQLISVTIPASVISIGANAFKTNSFTNASAITILGDATRFDSNWTNIGFPAK